MIFISAKKKINKLLPERLGFKLSFANKSILMCLSSRGTIYIYEFIATYIDDFTGKMKLIA